MSVLPSLTNEQASAETAAIFGALNEKIGKVPNIFRAVGHSSLALKSFLDFNGALKSGEFSPKEVEVIALVVGQLNGCNYCLSAHTAIGQGVGLSQDETIAIRKGAIDDPKLGALTQLTKNIVETKGYADAALVDAFLAAGYSKAALVELIGLIAANYFTNFFNHVADTELDFPQAPSV